MVKLIKNLTKKEAVLAILILVFTCTQVWFDLSIPDYMSEITMLVQTEGSEMSEIIEAGVMMLLFAFGSLTISIIVALMASRIASVFSFITRSKMFNKVMSFSMKEINHFSTSSLITRTTNDITQVQMLIVMGMSMLIKAPITAVYAIIKISDKSAEWSIATGVAVVILLSIVGTCLALAVPRFKKLQVLTDNINRVTRENLDGLNVVRAYNAEEYQMDKFEKANQELTKTTLFTSKVMSFLMPTIQIINNGLILAIYFIGAVLINEAVGMDKMNLFSDMVVFSSYAIQVIMSFMMLVIVFMIFPRASVSAKRINEVLDMEVSIKEGLKTEGLNTHAGEVEFKNVSFKYPDAEDAVLHNISFKANHGEVVAFIGATGCGKSTIINLVPRFYDATEGEVLVNGVNVKEYKKEALQNMIGYVSQKATLFTGTIESNVTYGDKSTQDSQEDMERAVETAQAEEFVESLDEKYDSYVAQGGKNLSGGQKQRISIARAIYRDANIFIFDDSFSALDYKTDQRLRHALNVECKDTTRLIVAQRIGTIRDADKIIVLEDGRIVGEGKHNQLLESCDVYKQIALSQLSKEEL